MIVHTAAKIDSNSAPNILMPLVVLVFNCQAEKKGRKIRMEGYIGIHTASSALFNLLGFLGSFSCDKLEVRYLS